KDAPSVTFTGSEYKKLSTTARKIAARGQTRVCGVLVRSEHVEMWKLMVHSFLRPSETELFGLRHRDVSPKGHLTSETDPLRLELEIHGKTGLRFAGTMPRAHSSYEDIVEERMLPNPNEYVFMPEYTNRTTAVNTARRIFSHFLDATDLKRDKDGNERSPNSLRHYALQARLRSSKGKVNISWLGKNAATSVDQLERFDVH
ncbi:MAG: integrase, partial [Pseudomonadota bacterium]